MPGKIMLTSMGMTRSSASTSRIPISGPNPTLGACRPDIREKLKEGDHLFFVTGKVPNANQFVMGTFEIGEKINAMAAYERFPGLRLHLREDGQLDGNIIIDENGAQQPTR